MNCWQREFRFNYSHSMWHPVIRIVLLIILVLVSSGGTATSQHSFWLTGETDSGAHTHSTSQSTFGIAVRACLSPRDRRERVEGSVKRGWNRPHSLGPDE